MTHEAAAARALLEQGIKVPVRAPLLFRLFGKKKISLIVPPPVLGTLYRIGEIVEASGMERVLSGETAITMAQIHREYIKPMCRIVAIALLNGKFTGSAFAAPLAAWLRWSLSPLYLFTIVRKLEALRLDDVFMNTIRSTVAMKMTAPKLSPKEIGS